MAIPAVFGRLAAYLVRVPKITSQLQLSALTKVFLRRGMGSSTSVREAGLFLTQAEEASIFGMGARFLVEESGVAFLAGAVLHTLAGILDPGGEAKTFETRLEIIEAHIVKPGPLWSKAIGVGEQVLFILADATGGTMRDALAGAFSTIDNPMNQLSPRVSSNSYYAELATPVDDAELVRVDTIFAPVSMLLQPGLVPFPAPPAIPPPGPPRPSYGRRR